MAFAPLVDENARDWSRLLSERVISPGRSDPAAWSLLEYACHVRDVYRRYNARIVLMLGEEDPRFPNWDQDASAIDDGYDAQDPARVPEIGEAAAVLSSRLRGLRDAERARPAVAATVRPSRSTPSPGTWSTTRSIMYGTSRRHPPEV